MTGSEVTDPCQPWYTCLAILFKARTSVKSPLVLLATVPEQVEMVYSGDLDDWF